MLYFVQFDLKACFKIMIHFFPFYLGYLCKCKILNIDLLRLKWSKHWRGSFDWWCLFKISSFFSMSRKIASFGKLSLSVLQASSNLCHSWRCCWCSYQHSKWKLTKTDNFSTRNELIFKDLKKNVRKLSFFSRKSNTTDY